MILPDSGFLMAEDPLLARYGYPALDMLLDAMYVNLFLNIMLLHNDTLQACFTYRCNILNQLQYNLQKLYLLEYQG